MATENSLKIEKQRSTASRLVATVITSAVAIHKQRVIENLQRSLFAKSNKTHEAEIENIDLQDR